MAGSSSVCAVVAKKREAIGVNLDAQAFGPAVRAATVGGALRAKRGVFALRVAGETDALGFDGIGDGHGR